MSAGVKEEQEKKNHPQRHQLPNDAGLPVGYRASGQTSPYKGLYRPHHSRAPTDDISWSH